jgi:type IV pilus assembly protein PilX
MMNKQTSLTHQSGAVLAIGLVMLLLLTLIGITGTQVTGLEEKMAGNSKDQNLAFQSAEAALRAGEAKIEAAWNGGAGSIQQFCNGTAGLFSSGVAGCVNAAPDYTAAATWTNNAKSISVNAGNAVATQPRYFITYVNAYNPGPPVVPISFTITARGTGGQDNTQVILRSYYGGNTVFLP